MIEGEFRPDWTMIGDKEKLCKELSGLASLWQGAGWYITKGERDGKPYEDSLLVLDYGDVPKHGKLAGNTGRLYLACVYGHHTALSAFQAIATMTVHHDER